MDLLRGYPSFFYNKASSLLIEIWISNRHGNEPSSPFSFFKLPGMKASNKGLPLWCLVVAVVVACQSIPAEGDMIDAKKVVLVDYTSPSSGMTNFLFRFVILVNMN